MNQNALPEANKLVELRSEPNWKHTVKIAFPILCFLIGLIIGVGGTKRYFEIKLESAVEMKRIMIKSDIFDLMPFDKNAK